MQSNMDINTFYHHALQWQNQQEEAEPHAPATIASLCGAQRDAGPTK